MKVCSTCGAVYGDESGSCPRDGTKLKGVRDPLVGRTVGGRYRLISRIGAGGMSAVYLARHTMIDRLVAVKTLRRDLAQDPIQRDRFIREARAVNRINHENIVEISDYGETDDGLVYLVMEFVPGDSLLKHLGKGPMAEWRVLQIADQIGAALGRAHQMGVVHRDLKPENILLVRRKEGLDFVKILDFGIAKILDAPSLTGSQQIFGTPGYIAPEYIQSTDIDGRADLYSLGVILYELVTGALPFDYEYPGDLLVKHVTEAPIRPSKRLPSISPAMEDLILRCLEKDPDKRFRDAYHFLDEVEQARERMGPGTAWGPMNEPTDPDVELPSSEREPVPKIVSQVREALDTAVDSHSIADMIPTPPDLLPSDPEELQRPEAPDHGLAGVRRWRSRFDALHLAVDQLRELHTPPDGVLDALRFGGQTLQNLEGGISDAESHQQEIEELSDHARDFRATLGRAIDQLAQKLSKEQGLLEEFAARRRRLRVKREGLVAKSRRGGAAEDAAEGAADAILWELATVEEGLRKQATVCDAIEEQLGSLRVELERRNESVEDRLARLVTTADSEMIRLDDLAAALRDPLDRIESFVQTRWS